MPRWPAAGERAVHLFVIPSWYPSATAPHAGLFVRDQVAALARAHPDWRISVAGWGHLDGALSLRDLRANVAALRWRVTARPGWRRVSVAAAAGDIGGAADAPDDLVATDRAAWHEALSPRLSWTLRWLGGGVRGLRAATRANLRRAEREAGPIDLVHAHVGFPAGWIGLDIAERADVPLVVTEHMSPFPFPALLDASGWPDARLRQALARAAAVVAVSPALQAQIRARGLPCSDVIPNLVDLDRFAAGPPPADGPFRWLFIGALSPQKGLDVLLHALALWRPSPERVQLRLGGDGPQRAALQALARELGVVDLLTWLGPLRPEQVPAELAGCHAFVLPSRHETFGVVLAEALAAGRPVLATRCGGPEAIVDAACGRLVPPDDAPALAQAMCEMVDAAGLYEPARLRAIAAARWSAPVVARQLSALYARVLAQVRA